MKQLFKGIEIGCPICKNIPNFELDLNIGWFAVYCICYNREILIPNTPENRMTYGGFI